VSKKTNPTLDPAKPTKEKAGQLAPINAALSAERKIELYTQMVRIRRFEERSIRCYQQGKIGGFCHTYIGQEAVAVGSISVLDDKDQIITAYRDHGHALAVGMSMNELMAEMFGKFTGCSKGKGGSMHFFAPEKGFWGGHGIVGGQTPLGAGLAFAMKYQEIKGCCLCYLGDGAVNQGAFHEALNLAALWKLPVIYIIENNFYSMGTSQPRSSAGNPLAKRALGYDMDYDVVDGNDIYLVREKTGEAVKRAKEESLPTILEFKTYRYRGHSMSDPETYRTKEEVEEKKKTDPIQIFERYLLDEGVLDEGKVQEIDEAAKKDAADSNVFAEESPFPPAEELFTDVYVNDADYLANNKGTV
jgi:pyruvate dehydrogenase E1 component alpha subunit